MVWTSFSQGQRQKQWKEVGIFKAFSSKNINKKSTEGVSHGSFSSSDEEQSAPPISQKYEEICHPVWVFKDAGFKAQAKWEGCVYAVSAMGESKKEVGGWLCKKKGPREPQLDWQDGWCASFNCKHTMLPNEVAGTTEADSRGKLLGNMGVDLWWLITSPV